MVQNVRPPRLLIFFTLLVLIGISWAVISFQRDQLPPAMAIDTIGQPTLGDPKAPVQLVVLEEPLCPDCARFTRDIFPWLRNKYIETQEIGYTVIPVSFLPHSLPVAEALICVYHQNEENPALFFSFLDTVFQNLSEGREELSQKETLFALAKESSPKISLEALENCIEKEEYRAEVEQNTRYGRELMKGKLRTPTLFINGIPVETLTESSIQERIDAIRRESH